MRKLTMIEQQLFAVLLHKGKTKRLIKMLKKEYPDKWQRAYRNVTVAYEELKDRYVHKSFFQVGVYDPSLSDNWPWHVHYHEGLYLSKKQRVCKMGKAAVFTDINKARNHFHTWKGNNKYKMEVIEFKKVVAVPASTTINDDNAWQTHQPDLNSV